MHGVWGRFLSYESPVHPPLSDESRLGVAIAYRTRGADVGQGATAWSDVPFGKDDGDLRFGLERVGEDAHHRGDL